MRRGTGPASLSLIEAGIRRKFSEISRVRAIGNRSQHMRMSPERYNFTAAGHRKQQLLVSVVAYLCAVQGLEGIKRTPRMLLHLRAKTELNKER